MNIAGESAAPLFGLAAEFDSAADLLRAAEEIRAAGYECFDVFSPFPLQGIKDKPSGLGKFVFVGGLIGFFTAVAIEFIPSSLMYPLIVDGKPIDFMTAPAFFPMMFELTLLFAAFTAFLGMLWLNGLPRWNHPLFNWDRFKSVSDDKFFVLIETKDPKFSIAETGGLFASLGGKNITLLHEDRP